MVSEEEIKRVAKLMRIEITDHKEYVEKVHKMIDYFGILDSAGVDEYDFLIRDIPLEDLREDKHIEFDEKLIKRLKNYKDNYVRAPKMI
ncbi:MAG: hypothetical protein R3230_02115 [Nitrosopumilaceae archaeon]|nr:hypothetical protein [Nitrosopumilaceae archaeon]